MCVVHYIFCGFFTVVAKQPPPIHCPIVLPFQSYTTTRVHARVHNYVCHVIMWLKWG
jgi:hypothetical protein